MNYYLVYIESLSNPSQSIIVVCRSKLIFSKDFLPPIFALIDKFIDCFLLNNEINDIGSISIYFLKKEEIEIKIKFSDGTTIEDEDLENGVFYKVPMFYEDNFIITNEGFLIRYWDSYKNFIIEKDSLKQS